MTTIKQVYDMLPKTHQEYFQVPYQHFKFADASLFVDYVLFITENTHKWYTEPKAGPQGSGWNSVYMRKKPVSSLNVALKKPDVASLIEPSVKNKLMANLKVEEDAYKSQHKKPDSKQDKGEASTTQESQTDSEEMSEEFTQDDESDDGLDDVEQQLPTSTQLPAHPAEYVEDPEQANKKIAELRLNFQAFQDKSKEGIMKLREENTELKLQILALQDKSKKDKEMYIRLFDSVSKDTPTYEALREVLLEKF